jgi:hypothetical protein
VTVKEPTVGLVLYDLRTTLRLAGDAKPEPAKPKRKPATEKKDEPKEDGADA